MFQAIAGYLGHPVNVIGVRHRSSIKAYDGGSVGVSLMFEVIALNTLGHPLEITLLAKVSASVNIVPSVRAVTVSRSHCCCRPRCVTTRGLFFPRSIFS